MNVIQEMEKEQAERLEAKRPIPEFGPGDLLRVNVKVIEGERTRVQAYEGVCIARSGGGIHESFTVRKISYGEGVERVFPVYSPLIDSIDVIRKGKVRRAKLYYLRGRRGKSARIKEKTDYNRVDQRQKSCGCTVQGLYPSQRRWRRSLQDLWRWRSSGWQAQQSWHHQVRTDLRMVR